MPISAICEECGTIEPFDPGGSFDGFLDRLRAKGWRVEGRRTTCPACARGDQEVLEGATLITYGIHELRHEPGRWGGVYWLWQRGGAYRGMFHLPDDRSFPSEKEAKDHARREALQKIRAAEWP